MIPIEPWSGPTHTVTEQQDAAQALRAMSPAQYYQCFEWDLQDLDRLEHGLFTKATRVASVGNVPVLEDLISRGADLTIKGLGDFTALHAAVQGKQLGAAMCLLGTAVGRQLADSACDGGLTPLMLACGSSVPLTFAKALVPSSDLAATDDRGRCARERAEEAGRSDIVTYLDMASHNEAVAASRSIMPPSLPDTLTVVDTFREVARDLPHWRDRIELSELSEMNRRRKDLLAAHRQTTAAPRQNHMITLGAVHGMKALRVRMLQRTALASVTPLTADEALRTLSDQIMAKLRAAQDRLLRAALDFGAAHEATAATNPHPFPLSVSLVPVQLLLIATQRQLERGISTPQEAEASLARATREGNAIIAQRQAPEVAPDVSQEVPPTLQE